jgi:transcriptional regulator with XRE-family HTH domain
VIEEANKHDHEWKHSRKGLLERLDGPLTFGDALRSIRECDEETQERFASRLGISKQHVCDIEKGRRTVGPARAARWAKLLGYGRRPSFGWPSARCSKPRASRTTSSSSRFEGRRRVDAA